MRARDLNKRLRDLNEERGSVIMELEAGEPLEDFDGLYLYPSDMGMEVQGTRIGARNVGAVLHAHRDTRHVSRKRKSFGVLWTYKLENENWWIGMGTLIGERHLKRAPGLRSKVIPLFEET